MKAVDASALGIQNGIELDTQDLSESAFEKLQQLYEMLPEMEAKGAELFRARTALKLSKLADTLRSRQALLKDAEKRLVALQEELGLVSADENPDETKLNNLSYAMMVAGQERGYRLAPAQNAQDDFDRALEESPFDSLDEALSALLPQDSLERLTKQVEDFQREYAQTLAYCQQLDTDE